MRCSSSPSRASMNASRICSSATLPSCSFGASPFGDPGHWVVNRAGYARFIARDHRKIAFVHVPDYLMFSHLERTGYTEAPRAAAIRLDTLVCIEEGGAEMARRLL